MDIRKNAECDYCGAHFHIKFADDLTPPQFCAFCGEGFDDIKEIEDIEEDDGDLDYTDDDRVETENYN